MNKMTLFNLITAFAGNSRNYPHYKKNMVTGLLTGDNRYSLMHYLGKEASKEKFDPDVYAWAVQESVLSYKKDKQNAIDVYHLLTDYINRIARMKISLDTPPVDISNMLERRLYITKCLHDPTVKVEDLCTELWVGKDTIDDDLKALRGLGYDGIKVCGKPLIIDEMQRSKGHVYFSSTAHPLFLAFNLSQILIILKGLKAMSEDSRYNGNAIAAAREIWRQLSPYAKKRIPYVLENLMGEDPAWYLKLDESGSVFTTEHEASLIGCNTVLDCLKNGKPCSIFYDSADGPEIIPAVRISQFEGKFVVLEDGRRLETDRILSSAYKKDDLL